MNEFDKKAATWDKDHDHTQRATKLASDMEQCLDFSRIKKALEYGSGTGLLSFALKDKLPEIVLMDASAEMTREAQKKVKASQAFNLKPVQYDILTQPLPGQRYQLVYILQTLHHIKNTALFLLKAYQLLEDSGYLVIIDLVQEDGSFHEGAFHGHHGFAREDITQQVENQGFNLLDYHICHTISRTRPDGSLKEYPLFMLVAQKQP